MAATAPTEISPLRQRMLDALQLRGMAPRTQQTYTHVWYSAYRDSTVQNIDNTSAIREALFARLDEAGIKEWLRRF